MVRQQDVLERMVFLVKMEEMELPERLGKMELMAKMVKIIYILTNQNIPTRKYQNQLS